jgi:3-oxoacyl-[acyl-carrier-protein] synthase-3
MPAAGEQRVAITGRGYALPATIRTNDDPVFDWLKKNNPDDWQHFFNGYDKRHVLAAGERLEDTMLASAQKALAMARIDPAGIDLLLGFASVSEYVMPNALADLHRRLGLPGNCWVVPINAEYSNFNASLVFADAVIRTGQAENALVVCGGNWSRHVNYHLGAAASAADGAGAAVIGRTGDASAFRLVDFETLTQTTIPGGTAPQPTYGNMYVAGDLVAPVSPVPFPLPDQGGALCDPGIYTQPYFHITIEGMAEFNSFGVNAPIAIVRKVLERNALDASQVTIISHQTSRYLLDEWNKQLAPRLFFDTLSTFANMTVANIPVNLAYGYDRYETDYLVMLGIGPELHTNAVLLRRNG